MADRHKRKDRKSRISVPDIDLWHRVSETVTPLRRAMRETTSLASPKDRPAGTTEAKEEFSPAPEPPRATPATTSTRPAAAPLTGIDRRTGQKLMRGQIDIDARLDLHGESSETARLKLRAFLRTAHAAGYRFALVITGKGEAPYARHTLHGFQAMDSPERGGRLRRLVPQWLQEAEFREIVSGFQPAHPRHGGGGALYVRLRRPRSGRSGLR